jgi:hypothetical protein
MSGLLVGVGLLIASFTRFFSSDLEQAGMLTGMIVTILGISGLFLSKRTMLD